MTLRRSVKRLPFACPALGLALLAPWSVAGSDHTACLLSCAERPTCSVNEGAKRVIELRKDTFIRHMACESLKVDTDAKVLMRYRHDGKWFQPRPLDKDMKLETVISQNKPDACGVPTPDCLQSRMATKTAAVAGHGVDSQTAVPAGIGEPCAKGLPCGVVMPPPASWKFRLEDPAQDGNWSTRIVRGASPAGVPAEFASPVAAGVVTVDGTRFSQGLSTPTS